MKKLLLILLSSVYLFAITPYSLENFKEVNIKVLNKKKTISKELEEKIENKIKKEFKKLGIESKTENYSNFLVKIKVNKIKDINFVNTSIFISEDVKPLRDQELVMMAITYRKSDSFEAENLEDDIYESVIEYLLEDFIEQYKEENEIE